MILIEPFKFLYPQWLFALIPLALLLWFSFRSNGNSNAWEKVIDAKLLPILLQGKDTKTGTLAKILLALGWLISVVALADPVWEKISRPVFQTNTARVIVLDLSNSMLISDLKPSRLARARFKIEDILSRDEEGQTGLVLFAGDAFTASPLTRDTETIRSLLKILTPQLMPVQGSRVDLGLNKAHELLKQAGVNKGQVLLIADGLSNKTLANKAAKSLVKNGYTVSVLGVGTEEGGTLKFKNYSNVNIKLETDSLNTVAINGKGKYHRISPNNADLQLLLSVTLDGKASKNKELQKQDVDNEQWKSTGPFLILLLIPLAALAFRRGWLLNVFFAFFLVSMLLQTQQVMAFSLDDLWKNKEQQAETALRLQQYGKVNKLSKNPLRLGSAAYKQDKYTEALDHFKKSKGANARYNEGNTLAKLNKYKEAIAAYDKAIEQQSDMQDAIENKSAIEKLLKQQQDSEKSKDGDKENQDNQQNESEQKSSDKSQSKSDKSAENQQKQNSQSSEEDQTKKEPQSNTKKKAEETQKNDQFSDANKELSKKQKDEKNSDPSTDDQDSKTKQTEQKNTEVKSENEEAQNKLENTKESEANKNKSEQSTPNTAKKEVDTDLTEEEKMAAEQWLRRIPDDPGGLLRRKFKYQYKRRRNNSNTEQPW